MTSFSSAADWNRIFAATNHWIEGVDPRYRSRLPEGVDLYRGHGRFTADHQIRVDGEVIEAETVHIHPALSEVVLAAANEAVSAVEAHRTTISTA
jgi:hypothetical protein